MLLIILILCAWYAFTILYAASLCRSVAKPIPPLAFSLQPSALDIP